MRGDAATSEFRYEWAARNSLSYNLFLNPRFSFAFRSSPFESGYHESFIRTTIIKSYLMAHFGHNQMGPFSVVFQDSRGCPGFRSRESVLQGVERSSATIDLRRDTIGHDMKINRKNLGWRGELSRGWTFDRDQNGQTSLIC